MYKIVGADGKIYGPASGEQLRRWLAEGRANAQTQTLAEGATEWKSLGALPEFVASFPATPPPVIGPARPAYPVFGQMPRTNPFATTGMICGILSLALCCCYGFPFNVLGIVFSLIGLAQISRRPEIYEGYGLAMAGLILSILSLAIFGVLLVIGLATGHTNIRWHAGTF
jgi:hypothetical protein